MTERLNILAGEQHLSPITNGPLGAKYSRTKGVAHSHMLREAKHEREVNKNELGSSQGCEGSCVSDQLDWIVSVVYIGYGKVEILEDVA